MTNEPRIVGVDPGGRSTGVVALRFHQGKPYLLYQALVTRDDPTAAQRLNGETTLTRHIRESLHTVRIATGDERLLDSFQPRIDPNVLICAEDLTDPNPHLGMTAVRGLIDTAQVLGAIRAAYPNSVVVRPGRHGSHPLSAYPDQLVGPNEKKGAGKYRHLRSAYDIGVAGSRLARRNELIAQEGTQ